MSRRPQRRALTLVLALVTAVAVLPPGAAGAHESDDELIWFPMQDTGDIEFTDSWGDTRGGERGHAGVDIMAPQMNEIYAATDGEIAAYEGDCEAGERCSSYYLLLSGDDGRSYFYVHLNNDTPGRPDGCDGIGGVDAAFSPRLVDHWRETGTLVGLRVERGEHVAYNGSSGNAGCVGPHLHFEVWDGHGWGAPKINPYPVVRAAHDAGNVWGAQGAGTGPSTRDPRIAGLDRVATSVALSRRAFDAAPAVVVAPGGVYPEALVAAPLAAVLDGPVLLSWSGAGALVTDAVAAEIERLGAGYAVLVGSEDRLPPAVIDELVERTSLTRDRIRRIGGADRYQLAHNVADEILAYHGIDNTPDEAADGTAGPVSQLAGVAGGSSSTEEEPREQPTVSPILALGEHEVPGRGWPDALSASVLAAAAETPILLTRSGDLPEPTRRMLSGRGIGQVRIVGGPAAISTAVEEEVVAMGRETRRLAGDTRYTTSLAVAKETLALDGMTKVRVFAATGLNFPDALAAGAALAAIGHPLLLVNGEDVTASDAVRRWIEARAPSIREVLAIGGPAAVADEVLAALVAAAAVE